jgi:anaphase-promoting complex subunit 4
MGTLVASSTNLHHHNHSHKSNIQLHRHTGPRGPASAKMETAAGPKLLQQAEKILLHPIHTNLISYCPTMDLIALVTDEENLDVYRINGQRAFGLKRKSEDEKVEAVAWQGNGASVAVAWSGGSVDVVGCETGKVVHRDVRLGSEGKGIEEREERVKCLGWGLNFIDVEGVKRRTGMATERKDGTVAESAATPGSKGKTYGSALASRTIDLDMPMTEDWDAFKDDTTLEDFLQRQPDFETLDIAPDLPDQLAMMDMETLLPKLPPIPLPPANPLMMMRGAQADAGAFSTQAQVDGLLHSHHLRDQNSVDMFIRCTAKGSVHPSIYDSMETVEIRLPDAWGVKSSPIMHASHPYACTHGLLMTIANSRESKNQIAYVPLTLGFIPSAGIYLHLIASKTAQLQNLLSYLTHSLSRIRTFFTHSQDLPGKFMRNIGETLAENNEGELVQNLYHLACTGHCPPLIHEWLVDELAEQGHKRWDNAVSSGLATVIQLLHENFLPALDRCSIIISRLRGLAMYYEDQDWIFSGPITDFTHLLDQLKNLRLLAHTTLLYAADEKRHFASFSKWLRYEIDFEATEPESQSRAEMEAKDPGVDISVVLEYIRYGMTKSDLGPFLRAAKDLDGGKVEGGVGYDDTRKAVELLREGVPFKAEALCLETVLGGFGEGVHGLLKQVSLWQENNVSMGCGIVLGEGDGGDSLDMRMVYEVSFLTLNCP